MNLKKKCCLWGFLSLLIVLLLLVVTFYLSPKIIFLRTSAEQNFISYEYSRFKNGVVLETSDKERALKLAKLYNTKLLLTPIADEQYEIEVPYHTFSSVKKDKENCFYLDFEAFIKSLDNVAVLDNTSDALEFSESIKTITYSNKISKYEVDEKAKKLRVAGVKKVVITSLSETKELLGLNEFDFYLPKGSEKIFNGSNIYTYSPDLDAIFSAMKEGVTSEISYKILPSSK